MTRHEPQRVLLLLNRSWKAFLSSNGRLISFLACLGKTESATRVIYSALFAMVPAVLHIQVYVNL